MNTQNPLLILAYGVAVALGIAALGWALCQVIQAIGAAIGIATTIITGGALAVSLSSWIAPAAGIGLAATGGATTILLLVKIVEQAKARPYEWTVPILAIVSAFVIDTCKELYDTNNSVVRIIYGASVTGMFLIGGILWKQKSSGVKLFALRIVATLFFLLPPFMIFLQHVWANESLHDAYANIPAPVIWSMITFGVFMLIVAYLSWAFGDERV